MIESQYTLINFTVSDYPHMKKQDKSKLHKSIYKNAYIKEDRQITTEELNDKLKRILIG